MIIFPETPPELKPVIIRPPVGIVSDTSIYLGVRFAQNLPDCVLTDRTAAVRMSVTVGGTLIVDEVTLTPDKERRITIPNRQFARCCIGAIARPASFVANLPMIEVSFKSGETAQKQSYRLILGGIAKAVDSESAMFDFLTANFLTAQPQIIETTPEQPQWLAFVRTQTENETIAEMEIRTVLYTTDGRTFTKTIGTAPEVDAYTQIDTSFGTLWREFSREKGITPVAYDVFGVSVISRDGATTTEQNRPLGQRYLLRPAHYDDRCFGFANSMGGFDTLMMQGPNVLKPESEIETLVNNDVEKELSSSYTSYWEASTGYIDTERMAAQYRDFLKSANRWIYTGNEWRRIIVDEFKVEHTPRELNAYTFKYHLAERDERRLPERKELPEIKLPTVL